MEAKKTKKASIEGLRGIFFECGLIVGLFVMIVAFSWSSDGTAKVLDPMSSGDIVEDIDVPITTFDNPPPPPEEIPMPEISNEILLVDNGTEVTGVNLFNPENMKAPIIEVPYVEPKKQTTEVVFKDDFEYEVVEDKPLFMGGDANGFSKWVNSRIVYPTVALENRIQGRVILQFRIGPDGTLGNIKVLRGVDPSLDKEAVRIVSSSPPWSAGKHNGKPVGVIYTFPVNFVITE